MQVNHSPNLNHLIIPLGSQAKVCSFIRHSPRILPWATRWKHWAQDEYDGWSTSAHSTRHAGSREHTKRKPAMTPASGTHVHNNGFPLYSLPNPQRIFKFESVTRRIPKPWVNAPSKIISREIFSFTKALLSTFKTIFSERAHISSC